ncbi:N-acetylglucosamine-6-phosphate deacetylase [Falsihalocynthiibacter arcticus]|uniref:N-acetylglucosamine-6-phosphate deacetylase n=1 Tax=Falsihalocynthiibacter arcticus TaxID=1579316 RepID=A0A126V4R0_9RHOB|nr:N-acetylglucosamine-6-phosphate deacetylase [Falsihalocynthiibacter arcticus]AML53288.1 N-acetylglucosamine-6-phosphate deacetylase [Falsihalocynthiibacter arcticus]
MMALWLQPEKLFTGHEILTHASLRVEEGVIVEIASSPLPKDVNARPIKGLLTPGYVDLQVNGGGDVLLNQTPTREGMQTIAKAHRRFGTVAIMPTVITDGPDVMDAVAKAAVTAQGDRGIMGLHIEGPHISLERRGTHLGAFVRPMDERTLLVVARLRKAGIPVMITLAPEATKPEYISQLAALGAVVSLGHTAATAEQMAVAIKAGARCATHLFNAMSPMLGREPGAVGSVINSELYSGIICDGYHVADEMIGLAIRARPIRDRMFLVSDAMATVGGQDHFELYGKNIYLRDGMLVNSEGSLAGAHVTQAEGVKRLVERTGTPLLEALKMATSTPAACMGLPHLGQLEGRVLEDVLVLHDDLTVRGTLAEFTGETV